MEILGKSFRAFFILLAMSVALPSAIHASSQTSYIEGAGGVPLALTTAGPENGPEILFLHGLSMGAESFAPQFDSDMAKKFRMVAFDLRGHANSGKPSQEYAYTNVEVWADDVAAVMRAAKLKKPIIVGWSYGTLITADYLRKYGTDDISGVVMIGALGGYVPFFPPDQEIDPEAMKKFTRLQALRKTPKFTANLEAAEIFKTMLTEKPAVSGWAEKAGILAMMVPNYVQASLRKHPSKNEDLVPLLRQIPTLVLYGTKDPSVPAAGLSALSKSVPSLTSHGFAGLGHSPFAERPADFNRELTKFVKANWNGK